MSILLSNVTLSQSKISFEPSISEAQELYAQKGCTLHTVKLKIIDKVRIDATYKVVVNAASNASAEDYSLVTKYITIPKDQAADTFIDVVVEIKSDTIQTEGDESFILSLIPIIDYGVNMTITPNATHMVRIKNGLDKNKLNKDQNFGAEDFRLDLGSNFDLLDGLKGQGLYANVFTYAPDLVKISFPVKEEAKKDRSKAKGLKIGILSGIRRNRTFNDSTTVNTARGITYLVIDSLKSQPDAVKYLRSEYNISDQTSFDNTSLHFSPIVRLYKNEKSTAFLAFGYNLERRKRNSQITYALVKTDSIIGAPGRRQSEIEPQRTLKRTYHDHHFFIKTPMFFKVNKVNVNIVPTFGYVDSDFARDARLYFGVSFNAIELKSGINLGGEVLGYFGEASRFNPPYINFYLSKALNLDLFGRYKDGL